MGAFTELLKSDHRQGTSSAPVVHDPARQIACDPDALYGGWMEAKDVFEFLTRLQQSGELDPAKAPLRITLEFGLPKSEEAKLFDQWNETRVTQPD